MESTIPLSVSAADIVKSHLENNKKYKYQRKEKENNIGGMSYTRDKPSHMFDNS